jgi:hypothetical protein
MVQREALEVAVVEAAQALVEQQVLPEHLVWLEQQAHTVVAVLALMQHLWVLLALSALFALCGVMVAPILQLIRVTCNGTIYSGC